MMSEEEAPESTTAKEVKQDATNLTKIQTETEMETLLLPLPELRRGGNIEMLEVQARSSNKR